VIGVGGIRVIKDKIIMGVYNYANLWLGFAINKQKQDFYQIPVYHEGDANFRIRTKRGGFIKYYGYISANKTGFRSPDIDSAVLKNAFAIENFNTYQNINWRENFGMGWKLTTGFSFSTNKDDINNELQDADNQKQVITSPSFFAFKNFKLSNKAQYAR
jgi:hypothetical protein